MSHGIELITKTSKIDDDLRIQLLKHPYFATNETSKALFHLQDHFIGETPNEFDIAVLEFLKREGFDHTDKVVEYWFQKFNHSSISLGPHCDYNFIYREKMKLAGDDWPHTVNKDVIVSPITIAVYLEVNDLYGGELGVSYRTWYEDTHPIKASHLSNIKHYPYILYKPKQSEVLYFKGSEHYHWVEPITQGIRRGMLINFWPKELLDK